MLHRGVEPIHAACGVAHGCTASGNYSQCESWLSRLMTKLCCTVLTYRYRFYKEWYRTRRI
jgi:hypothetical protein